MLPTRVDCVASQLLGGQCNLPLALNGASSGGAHQSVELVAMPVRMSYDR